MSSLSIAPPHYPLSPCAPASLKTPHSFLTSFLLPVGIPVYRCIPKDSKLTSTDERESMYLLSVCLGYLSQENLSTNSIFLYSGLCRYIYMPQFL